MFPEPARALAVAGALALISGCTTINDSGVTLHRKPDLSQVIPGTAVERVAALQKPAKKEMINESDPKGPEVWLYEWDLPDDGVNNKMFTSVVVKDGIILGYAEETSDKWMKNPQLHKLAQLDSAFEDMTALNARVAHHERLPPGPSNVHAAPAPDTRGHLLERSRFIAQQSADLRTSASGVSDWQVRPFGRQVGPVEALLAQQSSGASVVSVPLAVAPVSDTSAADLLPATDPSSSSPSPGAVTSSPSTALEPIGDIAVMEPSTPPLAETRTLAQLEAEELRIRKDTRLNKKERMQKLREIWKQQLEVASKKAA